MIAWAAEFLGALIILTIIIRVASQLRCSSVYAPDSPMTPSLVDCVDAPMAILRVELVKASNRSFVAAYPKPLKLVAALP